MKQRQRVLLKNNKCPLLFSYTSHICTYFNYFYCLFSQFGGLIRNCGKNFFRKLEMFMRVCFVLSLRVPKGRDQDCGWPLWPAPLLILSRGFKVFLRPLEIKEREGSKPNKMGKTTTQTTSIYLFLLHQTTLFLKSNSDQSNIF